MTQQEMDEARGRALRELQETRSQIALIRAKLLFYVDDLRVAADVMARYLDDPAKVAPDGQEMLAHARKHAARFGIQDFGLLAYELTELTRREKQLQEQIDNF